MLTSIYPENLIIFSQPSGILVRKLRKGPSLPIPDQTTGKIAMDRSETTNTDYLDCEKVLSNSIGRPKLNTTNAKCILNDRLRRLK